MSKKWNEKEDSKLKELIEKGLLTEEIAKELNRSFKSVAHRRADLTRGESKLIKKEETIITPKQEGKIGVSIIELLREELQKQANSYSDLRGKVKIDIKNGDTLVIHFTDWHIGKVIKDEFGKQIYNI